MKVERGTRQAGDTTAGVGGKQAKKTEGESNFVAALEGATQDSINQDLDDLYRRIEEQADVLVKKRTDTELTKYRELIGEFMKGVLDKGFKVAQINSVHVMDNGKVFVVAQRIEEKLLQMAEKIASGKAEAMEVAATTSEIRGLLFDLRG